ncbi:MAG TPA: acyltransferase [Bacteroidales bacterium]|nr:acyltransferase [Bacteroidales bacterium]
MKIYKSHGDGSFAKNQFKKIGENVIFENGVMVFHPENISLGNNIYIGHQTILKAYYKNEFIIGDGTWIGQQCFFHSAGGINIGKNVGIGPGVKIITSMHDEEGINIPILHSKLVFKKVIIDDDADIGTGAVILPGVHIGKGVQIGAGAVVTSDVPDYHVVAGVPAKTIKIRK